MVLEELTGAIDQLIVGEGSEFCDPSAMVALERQLSRLEGVVALAAQSFEEGGRWGESGARNATSYLMVRTKLPKAVLRRQVRLGRSVRQCPLVKEAWLQGDLSSSHVDGLTRLARPRTEEAFGRDQALLVTEGTKLRFDQFTQMVAYWELHANPDGSEAAAQDKRDRREAWLAETIGGMWLGRQNFDPVSGAIVATELARLEAQLFGADCAEAEARLGRKPQMGELARTPGQRRCDALVEMATRSGATPEGSTRPRPLFSVAVGWETLHGPLLELAQGLVVTPGTLLPWLEYADLERAVFEPKGRVEISERSRFFTGATRRALELRDRECTHEYCDVAARSCQGDHIEMWKHGGVTRQENGRLLCGFHNRLRNHFDQMNHQASERPPPRAEGP